MIPSEKYLLTQRLFTFLDEWGFYGVLTVLYYTGVMYSNPLLFGTVTFLGIIFISISYRRQWQMESLRFNNDSK